jgi:hypothetical protein
MSGLTHVLDNGNLRLTFKLEGDQVTGLTVEVNQAGQWQLLGAMRPLSRVVFKDRDGRRQELELPAQIVAEDVHQVRLLGSLTDQGGCAWQFNAAFSLSGRPYVVKVDYQLEVSEGRQVFCWQGPTLLVGEGSFGTAKDEALFPGLEYLLDDEPSSDTRFAAEKYAQRSVPHPYKITIPLMAVSHQGRSIGLMWDPNQGWNNAWRHPAAVFSSPNRLVKGANNHWLGLSAPAVEPRWRSEGELEAHTPCGIDPGRPWTLSAHLAASPSGGTQAILHAWIETYGLPELPNPGHDYRTNVELCTRSFLDVAWDAKMEGWHHTLSDPWGPRYEPNLANLLWRYGRWAEGSQLLRACARDQVRRGVARARQKNPASAPHMDLALAFGQVHSALTAAGAVTRQTMTEQQPDGSWPWKPETVQVAEFKTADRLALMGQEGDSATGFTASRAHPVVQYALMTGDVEAVASAQRAADWCNHQRRPEGAQAWELHLHVPDVLAVPYLIRLNLGVYQLTGDASYLEAANRWAWTGLPFTYLWNAYYRPVMRYGTVPVFGVTFHDVQPWFGVIVHWNGLVYADALFRLARYIPTDGPLDWHLLAEGIVRHGMQEQLTLGPYLGMYPDAYSPVKGDEEYTWWLNPQLVGITTFPLAGLPVSPETAILRDQGGRAIYITTGASLLQTAWEAGGTVRLLLSDQPGEDSYTLVARARHPGQVNCEGAVLPEVEDVDRLPQGWQWLEDEQIAIIKTHPSQGIATLSITQL